MSCTAIDFSIIPRKDAPQVIILEPNFSNFNPHHITAIEAQKNSILIFKQVFYSCDTANNRANIDNFKFNEVYSKKYT